MGTACARGAPAGAALAATATTTRAFWVPALLPAEVLAKALFKSEPARALFAGLAAHSFLSLRAPLSAAFGIILGVAGHAVGWPFPRGGSQKIADALGAYFTELGGQIQTDCRIDRLEQLPAARATLLDVSPWQLARMTTLPSGYARRLRRFRHAPGVCKLDYALSAPIPWLAEGCRRAGTVHVGGTLEEVTASEREVTRGRHAGDPLFWSRQQSLFDNTRAPRDSTPSGPIATSRTLRHSTRACRSRNRSSVSHRDFGTAF